LITSAGSVYHLSKPPLQKTPVEATVSKILSKPTTNNA
jgi:hypothetical protein